RSFVLCLFSMYAPLICPRCGYSMMPWRHSQTWRAMTCWACSFVKIERVDEKERRVVDGGNRQRTAISSSSASEDSASDLEARSYRTSVKGSRFAQEDIRSSLRIRNGGMCFVL